MSSVKKTEATNSPQTKAKSYKWYIGGMAGSVASTATHPLDLLKVRLQVAKAHSSHQPSLRELITAIARKEGPVGFYRGLTSSVMRQMTYSSARFNIYFTLKNKIAAYFGNDSISFLAQIACASVSGVAGACAGNVFDLLNIRMQSNAGLPKDMHSAPKNAMSGLLRLVREESLRGCFTGLPTNIQRAVVITMAQLVSYERAKGFLQRHGFADSLSTHFLSSMISGLITVTVSNPVDVVKSVIMSSPPEKYPSGFKCALTLLRKNGPFYFLKGWLPSYVRLGPHTVITFVALEQLKKFSFLQK